MTDHTFISYAHEDSHFATRLAHDLRRQGLEVWVEQWDIPPEVEWDVALGRAIKSCRYFLLVLSPAAVDSWVVRDQFMLARRNGKRMVPVLYRPCRLPSALQDLVWIDFSGRHYHEALRQLLNRYFPEQVGQLESRPNAIRANLVWLWQRTILPLVGKLDQGSRPSSAGPLPPVDRPEQPVELKYEAGPLFSSGSTPLWLPKLLRLLWPGWLGPLLASVGLIAGLLFLWPGYGPGSSSSAAVIATLEIVRPSPTPQPLPTPVNTQVRPKDGKVMVLIPAGEFLMGSVESDRLAEEDELPQRPVYLDAYWIDKTEISNVQYQLCVEDGACSPPRSQGSRFEDSHQPVVGVDWHQADAYCQWSGGRLPSEAEWEKAARGTDGRIYPWGDRFDGTRLNFCDAGCVADWKDRRINDGYSYTAPVGNYPRGASPFGVLDMSGNVWEWTADWYDAGYYSRAAARNPTGPPSGEQRVVRGGSWYYYGKNLRAANRHRDAPTYRYDNIGFRCVVDVG